MYRLFCYFFFAAVCTWFALSTVAHANNVDDQYRDILRDGVVFVQTQKWDIASDYWARNAAELAEKKNSDQSQLAFLSLMMTISLERADNAEAYQSWTRALGLYLQNGTNWDRERQALANSIEKVKYEVSTSFSSDGVGLSSDAKNALVLESLDNILQFTQYAGPKPGLSIRETGDDGFVSVSRSYFPRPSAYIETDAVDVVQRSRSAEVVTVEGEATLNSISRGFQPLVAAKAGDESEMPQDVSGGDGAGDLDFYLDFGSHWDTRPKANPPVAFPSTAVAQQALGPISASIEEIPTLEVEENEERKQSKLVTRRVFLSDDNSLTDAELEFGKRAWRYFENNYQANTGLYNSVHKYPYATMWDIGSALAALYCAHDIGIVDELYFKERTRSILNTLKDIPLYKDKLPNREYDTRSGLMTNLKNVVDDHGSGYSSLDIGRTLTWLSIIAENHDEFSEVIGEVVGRWDLVSALEGGEFYRELFINGKVDRKQEGRIGYEQYAALAFAKWDQDAKNAMDIDTAVPATVSGIEVLRDSRKPDFLNLEPYLIAMLEYAPVPAVVTQQISALLSAHIAYAKENDLIVLFTEDSIDETPWFLYNIIAAEEGNWICKSSRNEIQERCQTLSTKAAFMSEALFDLDYVMTALTEIEDNFDTRNGYYAGIYGDRAPNKALTSNTNALILESLAFKRRGSAFIDSSYSERAVASRSRLAN